MFVSVSCDSTQLGSITSQEKLFTLTLPVSRQRCTSPGAASRGLSITASSGGWRWRLWRAGGGGKHLFAFCNLFHVPLEACSRAKMFQTCCGKLASEATFRIENTRI